MSLDAHESEAFLALVRKSVGPVAVLLLLGVVFYSEAITSNMMPRPDALSRVGSAVVPFGVPSVTSGKGRIHVTYWEKWTDFEAQAMQDVVDRFNRSQNKIWVDYLTMSQIDQKVLVAASGGIPPDVAGLYGPNVPVYADDNAVIPLDSYCKKYGINKSQYIPAFWNIGFYKGHVYALPSTPASVALHWNKAIFARYAGRLRAAGLDPTRPPRTLEELTKYADALTIRENGKIVIAGFLPAEPGWWNWAWGDWFGGHLWNGRDRLTANSPENIRGFTWVQAFSKKYGPQAVQTFRSGFGNFSSPQNAFMTGKVAMELQGVWMYNFITKFAPNLKWGVAPFPYPADRPDLKNMTIADEDVLCIPRGARHPAAAFQFIRYVESQQGMEMLCMGQRKFTPLIKVSPWFWKHHPNPYIRLFRDLTLGKNVVATPQTGIWSQYNDELNNAFESVSLDIKSPKQALDDVQQRMQPKLEEYLDLERRRKGQK
ncbi:MAG TPA: ABC transporter substrate-binding protein [Armatimonadota bacterium]|nr:ABC transporter substrate-binding protein [Armatimonadota bacterium]